jgi:hypothetical protein
MVGKDADYRGFHIIINVDPIPDQKWRARATLHEGVGHVTPLLAVERLTAEDAVEVALDQAQREIDKMLRWREIADDQEAELKSREHLG